MKISYQTALEIQTGHSSKGNQHKYHINDEWIKLDYLGYESASEYLCSELLKDSNVKNYVSYSIENIELERRTETISNKIGCLSKNFLESGAELITLDKLFNQYNTSFQSLTKNKSVKDSIKSVVDFIEDKTGIVNYGKYLTSLLEFDALILNEDRHINNIIFLYKDSKFTPGPIFDNGAAYLSDTEQDYPLNESARTLIKYVNAKPFSNSFEKQVNACHELYGKQLTIQDKDITPYISKIDSFYGNIISRRINLIYTLQKDKYKDMFIEPIKEIDLQKEFATYLKHGGQAVCCELQDNHKDNIINKLNELQIPFAVLENDNQKIIAVIDSQKDTLSNVLTEEYPETKTINIQNITLDSR